MGKYSELVVTLITRRKVQEQQLGKYNSYISDKAAYASLSEQVVKRKEFFIDGKLKVNSNTKPLDNREVYDILSKFQDDYTILAREFLGVPIPYTTMIEKMSELDFNIARGTATNDDYLDLIHILDREQEIFGLERVKRLKELLFGVTSEDAKRELKFLLNDICTCLAKDVLGFISRKMLNKEFGLTGYDAESAQEARKIVKAIKKFQEKFSSDGRIIVSFSREEITEFEKLLTSTGSNAKRAREIATMIRADQGITQDDNANNDLLIKTSKRDTVNFDNLDMSKFTNEEQRVIETIKRITEDNKVGNKRYDAVGLDISERLKAYKGNDIEDILSDVKGLLNHIYSDKDSVIAIFIVIIEIFEKNELKKTRKQHVKELDKIVGSLDKIIYSIHRKYQYTMEAYEKTEDMLRRKEDVRDFYLPTANELIELTEINDLDDLIADKIVEYKEYIAMQKAENAIGDSKPLGENTDNLVFCLEDMSFSDDGSKTEFIGSVRNLAYRNLRDLRIILNPKKRITRLRKTIEFGEEIDFVNYFKRNGRRPHFVPYILGSSGEYRTGLIKFEPSTIVKTYLDEKYGLSNTSAYYGIFMIVPRGSNYNELESYVENEVEKIEKLARLFSSENPTVEELRILDERIKQMLDVKNEIVKNIESSSQK